MSITHDDDDWFVGETASISSNGDSKPLTVAVGNEGRSIPYGGAQGVFGAVGWDRALVQITNHSFIYLDRQSCMELAVMLAAAASRMADHE